MRFCLMCNKFFETNEDVRDHVIKEHNKAMFTSALKRAECKLHDDGCNCKECHAIDLLISPTPKKGREEEPVKIRRNVHDKNCFCKYCMPLELIKTECIGHFDYDEHHTEPMQARESLM